MSKELIRERILSDAAAEAQAIEESAKQKGDEINFVTHEHQLSFAYDTIYIVSDTKHTPLPARKFIDDKRTVLIGSRFNLFKTKELSAIVMACRPDYLLYETQERDKYGNAHFVTFYANGKLITNQQDYHNTKQYQRFTIVADKWFWKATDEEIIFCLEQLKNDKNLMFFEPISLNRLLSNNLIRQKFLQLHFSAGTPFKWRNDYSSTNIQPIVDFLVELRSHTRSDLGAIPIKGDTGLSEELELLRCLQIIGIFKREKLKCLIIDNTHAHQLCGVLETWTRYALQLSFIEYILHPYCLKSGIVWYNFLNNSIHWRSPQIEYLLFLLSAPSWSEHQHLLLHQWGYEELNGRNINYDYIKQNINLLYKEFSYE